MYTVEYARTKVIGSRTSFVIDLFVLAYIEMYVFRGNLFQAHSLEQSYRQTQPFKQEKRNKKIKNMCQNNIDLIYLTFIHSANKFEKHKDLSIV